MAADPAAPAAPAPPATPRWHRYRGAASAWAAIAVVLAITQHVANRVTRDPDYRFDRWIGLRNYFSGWFQFDGWVYLDIASDGYWYRPGARAPIVFFPFYPLVIRVVDRVIGDVQLSGLAVAAAAGLASVLLFRRWLDVAGVSASARPWALAVLLTYPYGWYRFGPVYSDALFAALVLLAFLLAERDRLVWAAFVGALVTATRPTGLAIVPGLLVLVAERHGALTFGAGPGWWRRLGAPSGVLRDRWQRRKWWPIAAFAGVGAYSVYLWVAFGNPLLWATAHGEYSGSGPKTWFKAGFVKNWLTWDQPVYTLTITAQALILLGVVVSAPAVGRRFGWGYATFVVALGAIPSVTSLDFIGVGRYLLPAFPTAALVGEWLERRRLTGVAWCAVCGLLLLLLEIGFARSRMLA